MKQLYGLVSARPGDVFVYTLLAASLVEAWLRAPGWRWVGIAPFALLWTLPLLLRRRSGLIAGLTVMAAAASSMIVTGGTVASAMWVAMLMALGVIGLYEEGGARAIAGATLGTLLLLAVAVTDQGLHVVLVLTVATLAFGPFAAGRALRARGLRAADLTELAQRLEWMQEEEARIAVAEERGRIAAELNEVIARAVSGMTAQAGAARILLHKDRLRARDAIEAIEDAGREALAETRRLLGVLRSDLAEPEREPPPELRTVDNYTVETPGVVEDTLPVGYAS